MIHVFQVVSEYWSNRYQSWNYECLLLAGDHRIRVTVETSNSRDQAEASIYRWNGEWQFVTSLPHEEWWEDAPSYTRRELTDEQRESFRWVRSHLLDVYAKLLLGGRDWTVE